MLTKLKIVVFGLCAFMSQSICAQQKSDSVKVLKEVIVEQSRLGNYSISQYTLPIDSLTRSLNSGGSLADLLRKSGIGHLRSYGPGGLATASLRGTGSSHTAILWNGINLISPLAGQLDLSLVPVGFIDEASVQSGGAASLYGNGSIGGTINLNNRAAFNEGLKLKTFINGGSFGSYYHDLGVSWSGKKFVTSTKVFLGQAKNDFKFLDKDVYPFSIQRRQHTGFNQKGILQQFYWQASQHDLITVKFWYQDNLYETPNPTSVPRPSQATERNTYSRALAGWNHSFKNFDLNYQSAFVHHNLDYRDPAMNLISPSIFNTSINNLEGNFSFKNGAALTSGLNYTWEQGKVDDFASAVPVRNRVALFSAFKFRPVKILEVSTSVREEIVNGDLKPVAPSITAKVKLPNQLEIYSSFNRNYRIPTFNDLYWRGSGALGDPNLKSETSLGQEVGMSSTKVLEGQSPTIISYKMAAFSSHIDNWIQWNQVSATIWSPQNILKVWSRGVEAQVSAQRKINAVSVEFLLQYSFTKVTNERIYENVNDNELNKQLMLTPLHQGSATLRAVWKNYYLNIVNSYTGRQFTDADNTDFFAMPSYDIANIWLSKSLAVQNLKVTFSGEVNNVMNNFYQSRPGYPMPGRNFKIGLTVQFIKPNSL